MNLDRYMNYINPGLLIESVHLSPNYLALHIYKHTDKSITYYKIFSSTQLIKSFNDWMESAGVKNFPDYDLLDILELMKSSGTIIDYNIEGDMEQDDWIIEIKYYLSYPLYHSHYHIMEAFYTYMEYVYSGELGKLSMILKSTLYFINKVIHTKLLGIFSQLTYKD